MFATAATLDLPFSLVGDVVTLPWATYRWLRPLEAETTSPRER